MVHNLIMSLIIEKIIAYLSALIPNGYVLITAASALPLIELKGGILLGISKGLNPLAVLALCYLGSSAVAPLILILLRPVLDLVKKIPVFNRLAERIEMHIDNKASRMKNKSYSDHPKTYSIMPALFFFVALPLPLTGVYTGAAIACFLDADYLKSLGIILAGNLVAGLIVFAVALFFAPWADLIFGLFLLVVIIALSTSFIVGGIKKIKTRKTVK